MLRKAIAEFIGTFWLVFMGCGSVALTVAGGKEPNLLAVALAFGLTVVTMAYAIGHISGCHLNPAVSVGMVCAGRMPPNQLPIYVGAQFAGGLFAALVIAVIATQLPGDNHHIKELLRAVSNGYGDHSPEHYKIGAALIAEFLLTFIFLLVILGSTSKNANPAMAGLAIGLCLALIHIVCIPITGTSVNPARSFGPAVVGMDHAIKQLWLFILVPSAGAAAAGFLHKFVLAPGEDQAA